MGYFAATIAVIIRAGIKKTVDSPAHAIIIAIAVFVNIGVWFIEQLVAIDFEILSVSYIISESFLLGLHVLMAEAEKVRAQAPAPQETQPCLEQADRERLEAFLAGLEQLTPKERALFDCYVAGMTTDVIMEKLAIKENTLKFHSKNLYGKLGVRSRKQLMELHKHAK